MIRLRRGFCFRTLCCVLSLMLSCNIILAQVNLPVSKVKIVQVNEVGDAGIRMTKGSKGLGPAEGLIYRVDFYDNAGKLIDWSSLTRAEREAIKGSFKYTSHSPLGSQVLSTDGDLHPNPDLSKGVYLTTTTGAGQGSARLEVVSKSKPKKVFAEHLITTGNVKTIGTANTIAPKPAAPDMFLPLMLGVGAAGALAVGLAVASGAMTPQEWYISTPSGYRNMGGAATLGPYSSQQEAQSIDDSYFHGRGEVYLGKQADLKNFATRHILSDFRLGLDAE